MRRIGLLLVLLLPATARGDGGVLRLSERCGNYRVTVFTSPAPFRAGPVDVSVMLQDAATGAAVLDARVLVTAMRRGAADQALRHAATTEAATNQLLYAAVFELPAAGWWDVEVTVEGPLGPARSRFAIEAAGPAPRWDALWGWIGWPAVAVLLFALHRWRASRPRKT